MNKFEEFKSKYEKFGTVYIDLQENLFSNIEIKELKQICFDVPKEHITIGDAGEMNYLEVGRFVIDKKNPEIVNEKFSLPLLKIITQDKVKDALSYILSCKKDDLNKSLGLFSK